MTWPQGGRARIWRYSSSGFAFAEICLAEAPGYCIVAQVHTRGPLWGWA